LYHGPGFGGEGAVGWSPCGCNNRFYGGLSLEGTWFLAFTMVISKMLIGCLQRGL